MIPDERPEPGKRKALILAVFMHLVLAAVLFFGVQWRQKPPESLEVELWSARSLPAVVVPPPPLPEVKPAPPKPEVQPEIKPPAPEIALKEEKKPKKIEPPKPEPRPEPKPPEPKSRPPDFSKMLEEETRQHPPKSSTRQLAQAAAAEAEQRASARQRGMAEYIDKIRGKVKGNVTRPPNVQGNPEAVFEVTQLPSGEVLNVVLRRSSGDAGWDAAVERALWKSSPLPKPDDSTLFQRTLEIKHRPFEP